MTINSVSLGYLWLYTFVIWNWQACGYENKIAENKKKVYWLVSQNLDIPAQLTAILLSDFLDPETSSGITGSDKDFIWRFKMILEIIISCDHKRKVDLFQNYCVGSATTFVPKIISYTYRPSWRRSTRK